MTRKEMLRLIGVLGITGLFLGGVVVGSYILPKVETEPSEVVETVKENFEKSEIGKRAFKILGTKVEEETEEESYKKDEESEEDGEEKE